MEQQLRQIIREILEEQAKDDKSLMYALATNIAKTGKPQTQPGAKKRKLTPSLAKKREKAVKSLKKGMQ